MKYENSPFELVVRSHPSGRLTLTVRQHPGDFIQLEGELRDSADTAAFYRAGAAYMGRISYAGIRIEYHESETSGPSLPR